jgi:hypothetical protein
MERLGQGAAGSQQRDGTAAEQADEMASKRDRVHEIHQVGGFRLQSAVPAALPHGAVGL